MTSRGIHGAGTAPCRASRAAADFDGVQGGHDGHDALAPFLVRHTHHDCLATSVSLEQRALDGLGRHIDSTGHDDVVRASVDMQDAVDAAARCRWW